MKPRRAFEIDRRSLMIGGLSAAGGAMALPLVRAAPSCATGEDAEAPILVLIELVGGNDGLNTLVPYTDDRYYAHRRELFVPRQEVLALDDDFGLNPRLPLLRKAFDGGRLAILRGVGYPQPVYSHFKSFEIWHTASLAGRAAGDGWVGRLRAAAWRDDARPELTVSVGSEPYSMQSSEFGRLAFEVPEKYLWAGDSEGRRSYRAAADDSLEGTEDASAGQESEAVLSRIYRTLRHSQRTSPRILEAASSYTPNAAYPAGPFGASLRTIAALIEARVGTRVFSAQLDGFDTHANQIRRHNELLVALDAGLSAFLADLAGRSTEKDVLVAVISEFGRRVEENHSGGTDHGAAGLSFLLGARVKGGLHGKAPSLEELDADGNLVFTTDFRSVYATVIEDWFGVPHRRVLEQEFPRLPVLAS
jgi:uncharacterized protein (DUF1501 family)